MKHKELETAVARAGARSSPIHASAHREDIATHNEGFLEGICAAIDELRVLGEDGAADRLEAALFVPRAAAR